MSPFLLTTSKVAITTHEAEEEKEYKRTTYIHPFFHHLQRSLSSSSSSSPSQPTHFTLRSHIVYSFSPLLLFIRSPKFHPDNSTLPTDLT
jgi:hypothetical protein